MSPSCDPAIDTCCGQLYFACTDHPSPWSRCSVCHEPRGDRKVRPVKWTGKGKAATFVYIDVGNLEVPDGK